MKYMTKIFSRCFSTLLITCSCVFIPFIGEAQNDLKALLEIAERNYPTIAAKKAEAEAELANIRLEKNTLIPSLDVAYQANYATYNNITGMNLPGQLIPISGPPSTDNFGAVPGSAASLLMKWTPFTFGQRDAEVDFYQKLYKRQLAAVEDEALKVKFQVALLYLDISTTNELIKAFEKNVERNQFNASRIGVLVAAGLRPGVDSLKFQGELSKAKTELFQLQNLKESQQYQLQELLVMDNLEEVITNTQFFEKLPSNTLWDNSSEILNPTLRIAQLNWEAEQARLKQINLSWTPRLEFWGTTYARASGIDFDGTVNKSDGFAFSRFNYGVGLQVVFPLVELHNLKVKRSQQEAITNSSQSYVSQAELAIKRQEKIALNDLKTAEQIANEVPVEFAATESAFNALQVRYTEGLIDYTDLIQAQYDLLNAEAKLKTAHANTWKALLTIAVIRGDLNIFLNQIQN